MDFQGQVHRDEPFCCNIETKYPTTLIQFNSLLHISLFILIVTCSWMDDIGGRSGLTCILHANTTRNDS
jgi:nicotinamide riboside transporter PnuC